MTNTNMGSGADASNKSATEGSAAGFFHWIADNAYTILKVVAVILYGLLVGWLYSVVVNMESPLAESSRVRLYVSTVIAVSLLLVLFVLFIKKYSRTASPVQTLLTDGEAIPSVQLSSGAFRHLEKNIKYVNGLENELTFMPTQIENQENALRTAQTAQQTFVNSLVEDRADTHTEKSDLKKLGNLVNSEKNKLEQMKSKADNLVQDIAKIKIGNGQYEAYHKCSASFNSQDMERILAGETVYSHELTGRVRAGQTGVKNPSMRPKVTVFLNENKELAVNIFDAELIAY